MLVYIKENDLKKKILIADHEKLVVDVIKFNLEKNGYKIIEAYDDEQAIKVALAEKPDLILLDLNLPKTGGLNVSRKLRKKLDCPIIMLTEKNRDIDVSEIRIDDYMIKPFSVRELTARVKAHLRIHIIQDDKNNEKNAKELKLQDLILDDEKYVVVKNNRLIDLTMKEYEMLRLLVINSGQVFTREEIIKQVWGYDYFGDVRSVDVTARRIREKIEENTGEPKYLKTKKGKGYYVE